MLTDRQTWFCTALLLELTFNNITCNVLHRAYTTIFNTIGINIVFTASARWAPLVIMSRCLSLFLSFTFCMMKTDKVRVHVHELTCRTNCQYLHCP